MINGRSLRIAILIPTLGAGGAERLWVELGREFVDRGHTVRFIVMEAKGALIEQARQIGPVDELRARRVRNIFWPLRKYLARTRPDVLIANLWPVTLTASLAVLSLPGKRRPTLVSVEHTLLTRQYANWGLAARLGLRLGVPIICRTADAYVGVSRGVARDMAGLGGVDDRKVHAIHNAVPTERNQKNGGARAEVDWGTGSGARILTVGSLKAVKNQSLAIEAFARMRRPGDRLMILGEGALRVHLQEEAARLGVADAVLLPGYRDDPAPYYASANLFVLTSDYEGFGNVLVEALAAGLPIVSTDCPSGPAEILDNGRFGVLVPCRDAAQLATAMRATLDRPPDRAGLIDRAKRFSPQTVADQYLDLISRLRLKERHANATSSN